MRARASLERRLFAATIGSGLLVVMHHTGGPIGCSTTVEQIEMRSVDEELQAGQEPRLSLWKGSNRGEHIERGTLIELELRPDEDGDSETKTGALAGFDPRDRSILIVGHTREGIEAVPFANVLALTVLGESPTGGHMGNGALIAGLSAVAVGAAIGVGVGAGVGSDGVFAGICGGAGVGAGAALGFPIGAGVGAAISPGRERTTYLLGPGEWHLPAPAAANPLASAATSSTAPPASSSGQDGDPADVAPGPTPEPTPGDPDSAP